MGQLGDGLGLIAESLGEPRVLNEASVKDLDRNPPLQRKIVGGVHGG